MTAKKSTKIPKIQNLDPGQKEVKNTSDMGMAATPPIEDAVQQELASDKVRLEQLQALQKNETDSNSQLAKTRCREIELLESKIKSQEDFLDRRKEEMAMKEIGAEMDYQLIDGSIVSKKPAYIKFNRKVDQNRVDEFLKIIKRGEYRKEFPLFVSDAVEFKKNNPEITIVDAYGNEIPDAELHKHFLILEGQHRIRAFIICKILGFYEQPIPGVVVKNDITDVAKFLVSINPSGSWSSNQKGEVLALTAPTKYRSLCEAISTLVRKDYNRSTASQILTQSKPLTTRQIDLLLSGQEPKEDIIYNIDNGMAFIKSCTKKGITTKYLTKRYFIEGLLAFKTQYDLSFSDALLIVDKLPKLNEEKLKTVNNKDVFKQMLEDVYQKQNKK